MLALPILYMAGKPLSTADLWWQLALGRAYAEQGLSLPADPLTYTAVQAPPPHQWLFAVGVHEIERAAGFPALRTFHTLAVAAILALAYSVLRRAAHSSPPACTAWAVFATVAWPRLMQLRPDLLSILAALLFHRWLIEPDVPGRKQIAAAAALGVVWANSHALFALGPALLLAASGGCVLSDALRAVAARTHASVESRDPDAGRLRRIGAALLVVLIAALLNPRGIAQHLAFFESAATTSLWRVRDEWTPFHPFDPAELNGTLDWLSLVALDVSIAAFGIAALSSLIRFFRAPSERTIRLVDPVALVVGAAGISALFVAIRFAWMVIFPLVFLLRRERFAPRARGARWFAAASATAAIALPLSPGFVRALPPPAPYFHEAFDGDAFYAQGVEFLRDAELEGRLFNGYAVGGFAGYWLAPRIRTFVDGRMNFPDDVLRDYLAARSLQGSLPRESFLDLLDRRSIDLFFGTGVPRGRLDAESTLYTTASLERAAGWVLVSRSTRHAVYLRDDPRNRENLLRAQRYYARQRIAFDPRRGLDVASLITRYPEWSVAHGLLPRESVRWPQDLANPDVRIRVRALAQQAKNRTLLGRYGEAMELDRAAIAIDPRAKPPRRRLIAGLLRLDRAEEAVAAAHELVALDARDPLSRRFLRVATRYGRERAALGSDPRDSDLVALDALVSALPLVDAREQL
jgi:hypothetical protein